MFAAMNAAKIGTHTAGLFVDDLYDTEFEPGDVVSLRGQEQLMTVESYCDECRIVDVVWFAGNDGDGWTLERDSFDADMLINLDGPDA